MTIAGSIDSAPHDLPGRSSGRAPYSPAQTCTVIINGTSGADYLDGGSGTNLIVQD